MVAEGAVEDSLELGLGLRCLDLSASLLSHCVLVGRLLLVVLSSLDSLRLFLIIRINSLKLAFKPF